MTKFKILPKVDGFADEHGIQHKPGDIVELPERYRSLNWLEPLEEPVKVEVPPAKVENIAEEKAAPLEKPKRSTRKKSAS